MKRAITLSLLTALFAAVALPSFAAEAKSFQNVSMIDVACSTKFAEKLDEHPRACALKCASSGYGVFVEGKLVKFDAAGNEKAVAALKASSKTDHLRVNVTGEMDGETLKVASLAFVE
jgi:hypothetical protein